MINFGFYSTLPISIALMADFFIEDLVKTMIDRTLPNIPKMPMVTRIGPYITSLKSSAPCEISSKNYIKSNICQYTAVCGRS